jgi:uncharacterized protein YegL
MPNMSLTEIAVILDRSGSMKDIRHDMEGSFDTFIEEQRRLSGACVVSLYQFDDYFEKVYEERDIRQVPPLTLMPRGWTALLDAVGNTIDLVEKRHARKLEHLRPGKVVVVVITDGDENKSHQFSRAQIAEKVSYQRTHRRWQFAFLGANIDSFKEAGNLGMSMKSTANYAASGEGVRGMYSSVSAAVSEYRSNPNPDAELIINPDPCAIHAPQI